jgi:hypothetical protein
MHPSIKAARLAACATLVLLAACPPVEDPCAGPSRHTIVFFDQSASSVADSVTAALFRDTVAALADGALQCPGDAIHGFLVHATTRGKADRVDVVNSVSADTVDVSSIEKASELTRYHGQMDSLRNVARTRLARLLATTVSPQLRAHTDLLGTLEVVSDEMSWADSGSSARVYYLGDMHESMAAPRRNFDARPPANQAEAQAWADADTAVLREMSFDGARLANVEVRVLLGGLADKPGAAEVRSYWERLFANAGIRPAAIRYN